MTAAELAALAELLRERNAIDERIAEIIGRPMASGSSGEWIAAQIFRIRLADNAVNPVYDGWFASGALAGRTVNVKWYAKQESLLDMSISPAPDYYLVLTGSGLGAAPSERPWTIDGAYLFSAEELLEERKAKSVRMGVATSMPPAMWQAAEIYPRATSPRLVLEPEQVEQLQLFAT